MDQFRIQYLFQVRLFVYSFLALSVPVLFGRCVQMDKSRDKILDDIEAHMFQRPEKLDSLLGQLDTTRISSRERARINTIRGLIHYDKGEYDQCVSYLEKSDSFFLNEKDHHSAINKLIRAIVFELLELKSDAANLYIECEQYFKKHEENKFRFYASLGLLRMSEQLTLNKTKLFESLRTEAGGLKDPIYPGLLYAAAGVSEKNDSVKIKYFENAKAYFVKAQRWAGVYTMELNILYAGIKQDPAGSAKMYYHDFLQRAYSYQPNSQQHLRYRYGEAYLLAKQGKDEESIEVANKILADAVRLNVKSVEADCVELLSVLYKHIDDYRNAHQMLKRFMTLKGSEREVMRRHQVLALGAHYRYTELEREKLNLKIRVQRFAFAIAVGGLIFIVVLLIFWILLRESKHKQKILKLKNIEIEEQIGNLLDALKMERDQKTGLIQQVQDLKVQYHDAQEISKLLEAIDQKQISISEYEVLSQRLRPGWKEKLKQIAPDLTSTDLTYCMCLYLDMNNQTICRLLNVGNDGIKSAKKRIRNKLSLNDTTEIYQYLKKLD